MKRSLVLFIATALIATARPDSAAASPPPSKLRSDFALQVILNGLALPGYLTLMTTHHEGSHALRAEYYGADVTSFKVIPRFERRNGDRYFLLGSVTYDHVEGFEAWQFQSVSIAPYFTDVMIFGAADLALSRAIDPASPLAPIVLIAGMVAPTVDVLVNFNVEGNANDVVKLAKGSNTPHWAWTLTADTLALVAAWRVYVHGREILFPDARSPRQRTNRTVDWAFLPMPQAGHPASVVGLVMLGRY